MGNEKRKKFLDSIKQQPLLARINFKQYEKKVEEEVKNGNVKNILSQCRYNSGTEK